jgi:hypothetical protein
MAMHGNISREPLFGFKPNQRVTGFSFGWIAVSWGCGWHGQWRSCRQTKRPCKLTKYDYLRKVVCVY